MSDADFYIFAKRAVIIVLGGIALTSIALLSIGGIVWVFKYWGLP